MTSINHPIKIYIGDSSQKIRLWLGTTQDVESCSLLTGATNIFFKDTTLNAAFNINLTIPFHDPGALQITGKVKEVAPAHPMFITQGFLNGELEIMKPDGWPGSDGAIIAELDRHGYFYLAGEIEGHDERGKAFDNNRRVFTDIVKHVVDSAVFKSFHFYYERKSEHQLLLS